jgi:hypothetical protein
VSRLLLALTMFLWTGGVPGEPMQLGVGSARVTVPSTVTFNVPNVSVSTSATAVSSISFNQVVLVGTEGVRISVKSDGDLTKAGVTSIPASNISWIASGVTNGIGANGVLSTTTYTTVYQGTAGKKTGNVEITWTLSAPGTTVRAGTYQANLRWRFDAVTP